MKCKYCGCEEGRKALIDELKVEIAKPIQEECCYIGKAKIQADTIKWCLEILDNIGKENKE